MVKEIWLIWIGGLMLISMDAPKFA